MRNFARLCLAGVAVACSTLLLSGCVQPAPVVTPAATSSSKPLFASDEEALAAATKAYAAYLQMSDLVTREGGANPERLAPLVTPKWLNQEIASSTEFAKSGMHQTGQSGFDHAQFQSMNQDVLGTVNIAIYVCLDLSGIQFLDSADIDVTPADAQKRYPFVATFIGSSKNGGSLVLDGNTPWDGTNFC